MANKGKHLARNIRSENTASPADKREKRVDAADGKGKKRSKTRRAVVILAVLVTLMVVLCASVLLYAMGLINRSSGSQYLPVEDETFDQDAENSENAIDPDSVQWDDVDLLKGDHVYNLLLIGQDRRAGEDRSRSDCMIIVSINTDTNRICMVSLLRDLYVQIPGYSDNRINSAYAMGGMELLNETIEENFGIRIDGNIEVDFEGFTKAIDIVGGIEIELTSAEAYVINDATGSWLTEGVNRLNGDEALVYARIRQLDSDFGRSERQRKVLEALMAEMKDAGLTEMGRLMMQILPLVTTDLTNGEILRYAARVLPIVADSRNIISGCIPQDGAFTYENINGMEVLLPDLELCREYLQELLYDKK